MANSHLHSSQHSELNGSDRLPPSQLGLTSPYQRLSPARSSSHSGHENEDHAAFPQQDRDPWTPRRRLSPAGQCQNSTQTSLSDGSIVNLDSANTAKRQVEATFEPPERRYWAISIAATLYIGLIVTPWALICLLNHGPLLTSDYIDNTGRLDPHIFENNEFVQTVADTLHNIAAALTLPTISFVLAQAAVVWTQSNASRTTATVNLAHVMSLADRAWTNPFTVWKELSRRKLKQDVAGRNWFLVIAAVFMCFAFVIVTLQRVLVGTETLQVLTCRDVPFYPDMSVPKCGADFRVVGQDQRPWLMQDLPLWTMKEQVASHLARDIGIEPQPLLWTNNTGFDDASEGSPILQDLLIEDPTAHASWWISSVPNGTTTGVLRQHAMRLNFSIVCEAVEEEEIPKLCAGEEPFSPRYSWTSPAHANRGSNHSDFVAWACVPGNYTLPPYNNTRDAMNITEEIYLGIEYRNASENVEYGWLYGGSWATHCTVETVRGYFELGNTFNNFAPQPLLERYPSGQDLKKFNDYSETTNKAQMRDLQNYIADVPASYFHVDVRRYGETTGYSDMYGYFRSTGPLSTAAVAIFGNESFFGRASEAARKEPQPVAIAELCKGRQVPFRKLLDFDSGEGCDKIIQSSTSPDMPDAYTSDWQYQEGLTDQIIRWFEHFRVPSDAHNALRLGVFYANEASLRLGLGARQSNDKSSQIYSSNGRTTSKPSITRRSMNLYSVVLGIYVMSIIVAVVYASLTPTWTRSLSSFNIAQLANGMDKGTLPAPGSYEDSDMKVWRSMDGRVGVEAEPDARGSSAGIQRLAFGGEGAIADTRRRKRRCSA